MRHFTLTYNHAPTGKGFRLSFHPFDDDETDAVKDLARIMEKHQECFSHVTLTERGAEIPVPY